MRWYFSVLTALYLTVVNTPQGFSGEDPAHVNQELSNSLCFDPMKWTGRYPSSTENDGGGRFLDLPCVRRNLEAMMGAKDLTALTNHLQVEAPIDKFGPYIIVVKCETHNCPNMNAMIVINTENNSYVVGVFRRLKNGSATTWYSSDQDQYYLPQEIKERFLHMHEPA